MPITADRPSGPAGEPAPANRALPRRKTFEPVVLRVAEVAHRAHMLNLSVGGACLHARCALAIWDTVVIQVAGRSLPGRVSWVAGDRCGVRFTRPLTAAEVDGIVG